MPSRNILKTDSADSYYHVYTRGNGRQLIFKDDSDYATMLNLFKRYLSDKQVFDNHKVPYSHLKNKVQLLCYCLMPNHIHLLIFQKEEKSMRNLMQAILTSYSRYFNKKYKRRGPLFESRYKASKISNQQYLLHIARYIILNPDNWRDYIYSSLPYNLETTKAEWFSPEPVMNLFNNKKDFMVFLEDYVGYKKMLDEIKYELANVIRTY